MLKVGFGEAGICPPHPHPLAGFGAARTACHEGIHDPISARCAVFESGGEILALVSCEIIGLRRDLLHAVRDALPREWGLPPERLLITCTHTHGAPVIDAVYFPTLRKGILEAVGAALTDRKPRLLAAGRAAHEEWVGFNRRHLDTGFLPVDREIPFLIVREPDQNIRGILFHYACHPSVLGPDNLFITADWPGYTRRDLQRALGETVSVLYLKGTEGDINTGYSAGVSSLGVRIPTRTHASAQRAGEIISRCLHSNLDRAEPLTATDIAFARSEKSLAYRSTDNLAESQRKQQWWESEVRRAASENAPADQILHARVQCAYAKFLTTAYEEILAGGASERRTEQSVFRIGPVGFLSLPGEFFVEAGLRIKREALSAVTFPLGICGDYLGYFPTEAAFGEGGYETACARFAPCTADAWCTSGIAALNKLFQPSDNPIRSAHDRSH